MGTDGLEDARGAELQPFLDKLAGYLRDRGPSDHSISITVAGSRLLLSPLEQELVLGATDAGERVAENRLQLIRDCLGLKVKLLSDLRQAERTGGADHDAVVASLCRDVELAAVVDEALKSEIKNLTLENRMAESKQLSEHRRAISELVGEALAIRGVERDAPPPPTEPSAAAAEQPKGSKFAYDWNELSKAPPSPEEERKLDARKRREEARKRMAETRRRMMRDRRLQVTAAILLVLLVAALVRLWVLRPRELAEFSTTDFARVPGIEAVANRAPVLLVVVDEQAWDGLNRAQRLAAVQQVVAKAEPAGYRRVEFRSWTTPGLAEWAGRGKISVGR